MGDITTGLFAKYRLLDAADNQIDDTGSNGLNLPVTSSGGFPSRNGSYRKFSRAGLTGSSSAANNYARLTGIAPATYQALAGGPLTVAFWYKRITGGSGDGGNSTGTERPFRIAGDNTGSSASKNATVMSIAFSRTGTPQITATWVTSSGATASSADVSTATNPINNVCLPNETWVHHAFTLEAGSAGKAVVKYYKNGVLIVTNAEQNEPWHWTVPPDFGSICIGTDLTQATGQIGGYMHDVRVYSRALAAGDITDLYADDPPLAYVDPTGLAQAQAFGSMRVVDASAIYDPINPTVAASVTSATVTAASSATAAASKTSATTKAATSATVL
jgi:hypothetical protein